MPPSGPHLLPPSAPPWPQRPLSTLPALLAAGICAFAASAAVAADSLWLHNGSLMYYQAQGAHRLFIYLKPRPGLEHLRGRVLFSGRIGNGRLEGLAATFRRGCPPARYRVQGAATGRGRLELFGPAPRRAPGACNVVGQDARSANSRLVFTYLRRPRAKGRVLPWEEPHLATFRAAHALQGGQVIIRATDPGEPAWKSLRVRVLLRCTGQALREVARYRACDLRGSHLAPDATLLLRLVQYDADGTGCLFERPVRKPLAGLCAP